MPALVGSPTAQDVIFIIKVYVRTFLHILNERTGLLPCLLYILLIFNSSLFPFTEWIAAFAHGEKTQRYYYKVPFIIHRILQKICQWIPRKEASPFLRKATLPFQRH